MFLLIAISLLSVIFGCVGNEWKQVNPTTTSAYLSAVTYGNGQYVISGLTESNIGYQGVVLTSSDLINWSETYLSSAYVIALI